MSYEKILKMVIYYIWYKIGTMIKDIFNQQISDEVVGRINRLTPETQRLWGTMDVAQMLAHCNVPYAYTFTPEKFKKPNFLMKFILSNFVKKIVVSETPYKQNERTSPNFVISDQRDFEKEKAILIDNLTKCQELGRDYFEGKDNFSFGKMTANEWNALYYKHIDHHLRQFGI